MLEPRSRIWTWLVFLVTFLFWVPLWATWWWQKDMTFALRGTGLKEREINNQTAITECLKGLEGVCTKKSPSSYRSEQQFPKQKNDWDKSWRKVKSRPGEKVGVIHFLFSLWGNRGSDAKPKSYRCFEKQDCGLMAYESSLSFAVLKDYFSLFIRK